MWFALLAVASCSAPQCTAGGDCGYRQWERDQLDAALRYVELWNAHDTVGLQAMLADDVTLSDWKTEKRGSLEVVSANGALFAAKPSIAMETLQTHLAGKVVLLETLVRMGDDDGASVRAMLVLEFAGDNKVQTIRLYKGKSSAETADPTVEPPALMLLE
jgi:hypothetical protein